MGRDQKKFKKTRRRWKPKRWEGGIEAFPFSLGFQAACWVRGARDRASSFTVAPEPEAAPASTSPETSTPHPGGRRSREPISHRPWARRLQARLELWGGLQGHPGPGSGGHAGGGVGQSHGGERGGRGGVKRCLRAQNLGLAAPGLAPCPALTRRPRSDPAWTSAMPAPSPTPQRPALGSVGAGMQAHQGNEEPSCDPQPWEREELGPLCQEPLIRRRRGGGGDN